MLTPRQEETISHLDRKDIISDMDIIKWCVESMDRPRGRVLAKKLGVPPRRHSKDYFQQIINHYAQKR